MVEPTTLDFWYDETDFKLTNMQLLALNSLLIEANSYPNSFLYDSDGSKRLQLKMKAHWVNLGIAGLSEKPETF